MRMVNGLVASALLLVGPVAIAGNFQAHCFYGSPNLSDCAKLIRDLVPDKFTEKFPATNWKIVVISEVHSYTNGGFAAFAVAGVSPAGVSQIPLNRFSATSINGSDKRFSKTELAEQELDVVRRAVSNLMQECELNPKCDVFVRPQ